MSGSRTGAPRSAGFTGAAKTLLTETTPDRAEDLAKGVAGILGWPVFTAADTAFGMAGLKAAERNLDAFLSGKGGTVDYKYDEIASHPILLDSIGSVRNRFETGTFLGNTKKEGVRERLLGLKDGEKFSFWDYWDSDVDTGDYAKKLAKEGIVDFVKKGSLDTYFSKGETGIGGNGDFIAERYGNDIFITGNVQYRLGNRIDNTREFKDEVYDFDYPQPGGLSAAYWEYAEKAKPFNMHHESSQPVQAKLKIGPNNQLTIDSVTWGAIR